MKFRAYAETYSSPGVFPGHDAPGRRRAVAQLLAFLGQRDSSAWLVQRELGSQTHAFRDAAAARGRFPLLIYGPGSQGPAIENELLGEYLASHGYIFVSSPSWGIMPDAFRSGIEPTARDIEFLLGFARGLPDADGSRVALMGHSWGGIANVLVASRNPSITAVVSLDGSVAYKYADLRAAASRVALREYAVPSLFLTADWPVGALQRLGSDTTFVFVDSLRYADAYVVKFGRTRHRNFCSLENRLLAPGDRFAVDDTTEFNPDRAHASEAYGVMAALALRFLDAHMKVGSASYAPSPGPSHVGSVETTVRHKAPWPTVAAMVHHLIDLSEPQIRTEAQRLRDSIPGDDDLAESRLNDWTLQRLLAAQGSASGDSADSLRRADDVVDGARVLLALYPASAAAHQTAGVVDRNLRHDSAGALEQFREALRLDPSRAYLKDWIASLQQRPNTSGGVSPPASR